MSAFVSSREAAAIAGIEDSTLRVRRNNGVVNLGKREGKKHLHDSTDVAILAVMEVMQDTNVVLKDVAEQACWIVGWVADKMTESEAKYGKRYVPRSWLLRMRHVDGTYQYIICEDDRRLPFLVNNYIDHVQSMQIIDIHRMISRALAGLDAAREGGVEQIRDALASLDSEDAESFSMAATCDTCAHDAWDGKTPYDQHLEQYFANLETERRERIERERGERANGGER